MPTPCAATSTTSPSLDKSPTSYSSSAGGGCGAADGYNSKLSSFSDVPDTVARQQQRIDMIHDSTVTLTDTERTYVNGQLSTPSSPIVAPPALQYYNQNGRTATVNNQQANQKIYGTYSNPTVTRQNNAGVYGSTMASRVQQPQPIYGGVRRVSENGHNNNNAINIQNNQMMHNGHNNLKKDVGKASYDREKSDSANFSLTSSNDSANAVVDGQYVTSVV